MNRTLQRNKTTAHLAKTPAPKHKEKTIQGSKSTVQLRHSAKTPAKEKKTLNRTVTEANIKRKPKEEPIKTMNKSNTKVNLHETNLSTKIKKPIRGSIKKDSLKKEPLKKESKKENKKEVHKKHFNLNNKSWRAISRFFSHEEARKMGHVSKSFMKMVLESRKEEVSEEVKRFEEKLQEVQKVIKFLIIYRNIQRKS